MEQYVRDARIAQIYEGTNGIQALDLVGRKLPAHAGRYLRRFFHPVPDLIEAKSSDAQLGDFVQPLAKAFGTLQQATAQIARDGMADPEEAGGGGHRLSAPVRAGGARLHVGADGAKSRCPRSDRQRCDGFYKAKLATARFLSWIAMLPQTGALFLGDHGWERLDDGFRGGGVLGHDVRADRERDPPY